MSFFERKYEIVRHSGAIEAITAKQLYERILIESKSDYGWIAPASELVRVCKKESFPAEYAISIKTAILNCFANIECKANRGGDRHIIDTEDKEAIQYCYNSLYGINNEAAILARKRYLREMIYFACYVKVLDSMYHPGATFIKLREEWVKSKLNEYISQEEINFEQLLKTLRDNFRELIKKAEDNGDFKEDEEKHEEEWRNFYASLKLEMI